MVPRLDAERGTIGFGDIDGTDEPMPKAMENTLYKTLFFAFGLVVAIEAVVLIILLFVIRPKKPVRKPDQPVKTMIVLGSGELMFGV